MLRTCCSPCQVTTVLCLLIIGEIVRYASIIINLKNCLHHRLCNLLAVSTDIHNIESNIMISLFTYRHRSTHFLFVSNCRRARRYAGKKYFADTRLSIINLVTSVANRNLVTRQNNSISAFLYFPHNL